MVLHGKRFDRTRFPLQDIVRSFSRAAEIHNAVNILLQTARPAITDMGAVVVVAEENGSRHEIPGAEDRVVGTYNFNSVPVTLRPAFPTSTIPVLGNAH